MPSDRRAALTIAVLTVLVAAIGPHVTHAQTAPSVAGVAGSWTGWVDVAGNYQPVSVSCAPGSSPSGTLTNLLFGATRPLASLSIEGSTVRIALSDPRFPVLTGTVDGNAISGTADASGGRAGTFRLIRTAALEASSLLGYRGAYRFADGRVLLVDTLPETRSTLLYVVDATTGRVRAMYPTSATEFVTGPALFVPEPTEQTLTFEARGDRVAGVVNRPGAGEAERATRVAIREEEVRFGNGAVTLAGTLLTPASGSRHPAIVMTHGGGATLREWFWGFGYLMAARGFAVLAFDKRGVGESTGEWRNASFEELADDAVRGARYLQSRPEVDGGRIGFWGLSQGAWIAPLAAVRFGSAAFVLTMSGGGLTPAQGELLDSEFAMRSAGLADAEVRAGVAFQQARDDFMRGALRWDGYAALLTHATTQRWWRLAGTDLSGPATADDPFWANTRRFYFYDPLPTLRRLRAPLLAIFGELDSPQGVKANVAEMRAALEEGRHPDFVIRLFPNGRHNLMDLTGFAPGEYPRLQRFVPELFDTMVSWLERQTQR